MWVAQPRKYGENACIFSRFLRFFVKMAAKTTSASGFSSDSNPSYSLYVYITYI